MSASYLSRYFRVLFGLGLFALASAISAHATISIAVEGDQPFLPLQWQPDAKVVIRTTTVDEPAGSYQWFHGDQALVTPVDGTLTLNALTTADAGNYYVRFTPAGRSAIRSNTVVINVATPPASPVDQSFSANIPSTHTVAALLPSSSDSLLVYLAADGNSYYARLRPDGVIDQTFPSDTISLSPAALLPDHRVLCYTTPYLLNPDGSRASLSLPAGFAQGMALDVVATQPDGKVLLAQGGHLGRLNADLTVDPTFNYAGVSTSALWFKAFRFDTSGRIYAHANETTTTSTASTTAATVFRLTPTGALDPTFTAQSPHFYWEAIDVHPLADGTLLRVNNHTLVFELELLADDGQRITTWTSSSLAPFPGSFAVDPQRGRIYAVTSDARPSAWKITATSLALDGTFYPGTGLVSTLTLTPDGSLLVAGVFSTWDHHVTSRLARLRTTEVVTSAPSVQLTYSTPIRPPQHGQWVELDAQHVAGGAPTRYQWLALDGQTLPADTTSPTLHLASFDRTNLGRYQVRVENAAGTTLSTVVDLSGNEALPYLANLSGRALTGDDEATLIAGLSLNSTSQTLLRALGPTLRSLGVANALADPTLSLFNTSADSVASNDDAPASLSDTAISLGAYPLDAGSRDAAAYVSLAAGEYSFHVNKKAADAHGVALAEVYATVPGSQTSNYPLRNLSLRARTAPGEATAIAGFVVVDPLGFGRSATFLLRAVGPTLADHGITAPLADPMLTVYNSAGEVVAQNDNWPWHMTTDYNAFDAATDNVGAFHLRADSKDAAMLVSLPAGAYTMHASGGTGVVLLEIYLVP